MSEPFLGEIRAFGFNFVPRQWALCDGQELQISQNTALFSILGTTYGGDGRSTFGLPDLNGRAPMHPGNGPGLSTRRLGESLGVETVTLTEAQIPSHNHPLQAVADPGELQAPSSARSIARSQNGAAYAATGGATASLAPEALAATGGGQAHNNMQPSLVVNFCIALDGIFPARA